MAQPYLVSATQVLDLFKNNTLTVKQYAQSLLDRINEQDSIVKAWAYLDKLRLPIWLYQCGKNF